MQRKFRFLEDKREKKEYVEKEKKKIVWRIASGKLRNFDLRDFYCPGSNNHDSSPSNRFLLKIV